MSDSYAFTVDLNSSPHAWVASTSLSQLVSPWSFHPYRVEFFSPTLFFSYRLWAYALHGPGAACQVPKCHMSLFSTSGVRTVHSIWKVDYPGNPSSTAIQVSLPQLPYRGNRTTSYLLDHVTSTLGLTKKSWSWVPSEPCHWDQDSRSQVREGWREA